MSNVVDMEFVCLTAEERQDQNTKRRKLEQQVRNADVTPSAALGLTSGPIPPAHPSLPPRHNYDFAAKADSIGLGASATPESIQMAPLAAQALAGSNRDVVANRRAIRMANMSAAEVLKAELSGGLQPVKPSVSSSLPPKPVAAAVAVSTQATAQLPAKPVATTAEEPVNGSPAAADVNGTPMELDEFGRVRRADPDDDDAMAGQKRTFEEGPGAPDVE